MIDDSNRKATLEKAFLEMGATDQVPDTGMHFEKEGPIERYIGPGVEPFYYSIRFIESCAPNEIYGIIQSEIELAISRGRSSLEWKVYEIPRLHFLEDDLAKALAQHGFTKRRESQVLYTSTDFRIKSLSGVTVQSIQTELQFEQLMDIGEKAFGKRSDWLIQSLKLEIHDRPELVRAYIANVDGQPACAGWAKIYGNIGYLFGGGTDPNLRNRGAYKAVVNARCEFLQSKTVDFAVSECSPDSERVLGALNFADAGKSFQWIFEK